MLQAVLELRPVWVLCLTLLAALLILVSGRRPNLREGWTFGAALLQLALVASMLPEVLAGRVFEVELLTLASEFAFALRVDALAMVFALVSSLLWVATALYSVGYMRTLKEQHQTGFYTAFALCIFSAIGLAFSANPLTFFLFYEALTLATYPLVVHKRSEKAILTGRMYLAYTLSAGLCLLLATGYAHVLAPLSGFEAGGFLQATPDNRTSLIVIFVLFALGVGVKAGIMPLHAWLPAAMIAPTPVSALLHAVAVVKAGVFGMIRISGYVFGFDTLQEIGVMPVLAAVAGFTIVVASVIALTQDNLKRRLAYSTIGQLSYIVLGVALLSAAGLTGSVLHIVNHAFMKITLFFCAGAIYAHLHIENVSDMKGLGRAMPFTMAAFAIAAVGLMGIPPLPGFVSKWWLLHGALESQNVIYVFVLIGSSLLSALYFMPIVVNAFFCKSPAFERRNEAPLSMVVPLCATAVASIVLGLFPDAGVSFFTLARAVTSSVMAGGAP
jgi:multicomponent Na+:H+ antiporter subunit D